MTVEDFIAEVKDKVLPCPLDNLAAFERAIGSRLPKDYRQFLIACNGGYVGGRYWYRGLTSDGKTSEARVHHVGGLQDEWCVSLESHRDCYQRGDPPRIPLALVWIMDDPFGNAICLGLKGSHRGRVYFWDHEGEPDEEEWDGTVETAGNIRLLANSFTEFVAGLQSLSSK
jgi:SMI1 / KNR4 family (SUKH-1)